MDGIITLIEPLGSDDPAKVHRAQYALQQQIARVGQPGREGERAEMARAMAEQLTAVKEQKDTRGRVTHVPKYPGRVRREVARWIGYVAGEAQVSALKQALQDLDARETARGSLEQVPGAAATQALADAAVNGIGTEFRVGVINALGRRQGADVVQGLKPCATDPNLEVRLAAAEALANQADPSADAAITAAGSVGDEASARVARRIGRARIRLAETLIAAGQKPAGKRIYHSVIAGRTDATQKKAAQAALRQLG